MKQGGEPGQSRRKDELGELVLPSGGLLRRFRTTRSLTLCLCLLAVS